MSPLTKERKGENEGEKERKKIDFKKKTAYNKLIMH